MFRSEQDSSFFPKNVSKNCAVDKKEATVNVNVDNCDNDDDDDDDDDDGVEGLLVITFYHWVRFSKPISPDLCCSDCHTL